MLDKLLHFLLGIAILCAFCAAVYSIGRVVVGVVSGAIRLVL